VAAAAKSKDARYTTWFDRQDTEVRDELISVRDTFRAGALTVAARTLAAAILEDLKQNRGITPCSLHTMNQWLLHG
jgi:hypothetical protein